MPVVKEDEVRGRGVRRILYGHILTMDDGRRVYMARRKHREIFRSGKGTISSAMEEGVASWAIDETLLIGLKAKGVQFVGVRVEDTGDRYLTRLSVFMDRKTSRCHDYTGVGRGGSRQRYVAFKHFAHVKGIARLTDAMYEVGK